MLGWKIGTRSKLLVAALGLLALAGCVAPNYGYYDPNPYGYAPAYSPYAYGGSSVVLNYQSYGRSNGHRHWDRDRGRGHGHR